MTTTKNGSTALARVDLRAPVKAPSALRAILTQHTGSFAEVLPAGLRERAAQKLVKMMVFAVSRDATGKLKNCSGESFLRCALELAQVGLEPTGAIGGAHLVAYGKDATVIYDYRGLMELARRSGRIRRISAQVVGQNDTFDFVEGTTAELRHKRNLEDPGATIAAYAVAEFTDGGTQFIVLSRREIDAAKKKSHGHGERGPWATDYDAMAKKTAIRRLCNLLPRSADLAVALEREDRIERSEPLADSEHDEASVVDAWATVEEPRDEGEPEAYEDVGGPGLSEDDLRDA